MANARTRLLIVDDSAFEQHLLGEILREQGYRVSVAANGRDGYEIAAAQLPELILLDVRMPYMDGFAACRMLKANPATAAIPVIFLSSANSEAERVAGLSVGGVDFVGKPFSSNELCARIKVHLRLAPKPGAAGAPAPGSRAAGSRRADDVLVDAACHLIDDNLASMPDLDEIAARLGTYREKLSLLFREKTGLTVFAYVREKRIEQGALLLRSTELDVQSIALMLGFSSSGNFATAFREKTGTAPSAYRSQCSGVSIPF